MASDFGKDGTDFQHLRIGANLDAGGGGLDIKSPCRIVTGAQLSFTGNLVSLDGREGVAIGGDALIDAGNTVCLLSEFGDTRLGSQSWVTATDFTGQAAEFAVMGQGSRFDLGGDMTLTGGRQAIIGSKANAMVGGNFTMDGAEKATLGTGAVVAVGVGDDMMVTADGQATVGKKATVDVTNTFHISAGTRCAVAPSARITFGAKSGNCLP